MASKLPKANIHWKSIPASACIEDRGNVYVAHMGRKSAVVNWSGQDARQAQATLWALSRDSKNHRRCGDLFRRTRPLSGARTRRRRSRR